MLDFNKAFGQPDKAFEETVQATLAKLQSREKIESGVSNERTSRRYTRRFATIAIAAVLTVTFTTIALAVTGVININLGALYNSIFNNEEAAPYIQTRGGITIIRNEGDVTIEPIAVFYDSILSTAHIHMLIHDPVGGRLAKTFFFSKDDSWWFAGEIKGRVIDAHTASVVLPLSALSSEEHDEGLLYIPSWDPDREDFMYIGDLTFSFDMIATGDDPEVPMFSIFEGNWEFSVTGIHKLPERRLYGEFDGHEAQASLGALSLRIIIPADYFMYDEVNDEFDFTFPFNVEEKNAVTITLKDGTVIHPELSGYGSGIDEKRSFIYYMMDIFVDPGDVAGITFFGSLLE